MLFSFVPRIHGQPGSAKNTPSLNSAETINGLYKTELIHRRGPWRTVDHLEIETAKWVDWWNNRRLHGACRDIPPAEFEANYYRHQQAANPAA